MTALEWTAMVDEGNNNGRPTAAPASDSRHDRLKQALRANLKRRKSQARGRGESAEASSERHDGVLDETDRKADG